MTSAYIVDGTSGQTYDLGLVAMRLLVGAEATGGVFAMSEFTGAEGAWTIPHLHRNGEESFYVLEGGLTFTIGHGEVEAGPGAFIVVPRGERHMMRAAPGGGRLLTLWTPGGPEAMFIALSQLPADSIRDPEARRLLSAQFDSVPI